MEVTKPEMFIAESSGKALEQTNHNSGSPTQAPNEIDVDEMETNTKTQSNSLLAVVIVQVCLTFVLKGAINDLVSLILSLQLVLALRLYDVQFPANADIFAIQVQDVIDFKYCNIEDLIQLFQPSFTLSELLGFRVEMIGGSAIESYLNQILCLLLVIVISGMTALFLLIFKSLRETVRTKFSKTKKDMVWSGVIKSITLQYTLFITPIVIQMKKLLDGFEVGKERMLKEILITAPILIGFPLVLLYNIRKSQKKICTCDHEYHKRFEFCF